MNQKESFSQIDLSPEKFLHVSTAWASNFSNHRDLIQEQIQKTSTPYVSISHCPLLGGVLFSDQSCGLDVEVLDRMQEKIVSRVSTEEEMKQIKRLQLPLGYLWTAKEASWKATRNICQPKVISSMEIDFTSAKEPHGLKWPLVAVDSAASYRAVVLPEDQMTQPEQKKSISLHGLCWMQKMANQNEVVVISVCFL